MEFEILDGKNISGKLFEKYKLGVEKLSLDHQIIPKLVVIMVGDSSASQVYVRQKQKKAKLVNMLFELIHLDESIQEDELIQKIRELNDDPNVHGIIVQSPLPGHFHASRIEQLIAYEKDAEGVHPFNLGKVAEGTENIVPCTPKGIISLLDQYAIPIEGKHVTIIGNSVVVGLPLALLMMNRNATVTSCNKSTGDLIPYTKDADILIVAAGVIDLISAEHVKDGAVVVDVGINVNKDGKIVGDVSFDEVKKKVSYISTVPGGVGPMTVAMSIEQTIRCACLQNNINPSAYI